MASEQRVPKADAVVDRDELPGGRAAIEDLLAAPWIGYDAQPPAIIARFVAKSSPEQARAVQVYEHTHQNRTQVVDAAICRLNALPH